MSPKVIQELIYNEMMTLNSLIFQIQQEKGVSIHEDQCGYYLDQAYDILEKLQNEVNKPTLSEQ